MCPYNPDNDLGEWREITIHYEKGYTVRIDRHDLTRIRKILPILKEFDDAKNVYDRLAMVFNIATKDSI